MKKLVLIIILVTISIGIAYGFNILLTNVTDTPNEPQPKNEIQNENKIDENNKNEIKEPQNETKSEVVASQYVSYNGWLKVDGTQIKNEKNNSFTLKGISSHGLQWFPNILTYNNLKTLKDTWNINVFRIAMYTDENGYISNKDSIKQKLYEVADNVINLDMYVVIDWHILHDNNPNIYKEDAKSFFDEVSNKYKNTPNVIYEICNEPNGENVTWDNDVKPYADEIIPIIRKNSPKSLIIVGTPRWCQVLKPIVQNKLNYDNILYSCHFYAGTHKQELRDEVSFALQNNIPVIISEWGTTDASGNGNVDTSETQKWIEFLNNNNISFINWSFCNKNESSALITDAFPVNDLNASFNDYLSESGRLVKDLLK